jgi:hypothetical protein
MKKFAAPYVSKVSFAKSRGKPIIYPTELNQDVPRNGHFSISGPSEFNERWSADVTIRNGNIVSIH